MPEDCTNCGGSSYVLTDGFFYCNICGTQSTVIFFNINFFIHFRVDVKLNMNLGLLLFQIPVERFKLKIHK